MKLTKDQWRELEFAKKDIKEYTKEIDNIVKLTLKEIGLGNDQDSQPARFIEGYIMGYNTKTQLKNF